MADEPEKKESTVQGVAEAIKGIVEAVPIYQDAVQPLAKEAGKALGTIGEAVNAALAPLEVMIWSLDQMKAFFLEDVAEKLKGVPPERLVTPDPAVAGPAIEALRFAGGRKDLREMYANLLARAMDAETADDAHPAYVEVLRQLSAKEARLLAVFGRQGYFEFHRHTTEDGSFAVCLVSRSMEKTARKWTQIPAEECPWVNDGGRAAENLIRLGIVGHFDVSKMSTAAWSNIATIFGRAETYDLEFRHARRIDGLAAEGGFKCKSLRIKATLTVFGIGFLDVCTA